MRIEWNTKERERTREKRNREKRAKIWPNKILLSFFQQEEKRKNYSSITFFLLQLTFRAIFWFLLSFQCFLILNSFLRFLLLSFLFFSFLSSFFVYHSYLPISCLSLKLLHLKSFRKLLTKPF